MPLLAAAGSVGSQAQSLSSKLWKRSNGLTGKVKPVKPSCLISFSASSRVESPRDTCQLPTNIAPETWTLESNSEAFSNGPICTCEAFQTPFRQASLVLFPCERRCCIDNSGQGATLMRSFVCIIRHCLERLTRKLLRGNRYASGSFTTSRDLPHCLQESDLRSCGESNIQRAKKERFAAGWCVGSSTHIQFLPLLHTSQRCTTCLAKFAHHVQTQ